MARLDWVVSIHARHFWRASRQWPEPPERVKMFQSTPVISGGRAMGRRAGADERSVSIHARHFWRASLARGLKRMAKDLFQSTPVISGGRALMMRLLGGQCRCFNPRPSFLAGEP